MLKPTRPAFIFALRSLASSLVAWLIAWRLGFGTPYWASITVWVVAQPSRGMTISKGFYRLLGTCLGALAAVLMIRYLAATPWQLLAALTIWCGACAAVANLVLYFRSYAAVLASFTTAIVALAAYLHPDRVQVVARERVACVFIGIAVAGIASSFFARSRPKDELFARMRSTLATTLRWLSLVGSRASPAVKAAIERQLVAEAEAIQELTDYAAAESLQIRMRRPRVHNLLAALFSTLSAVRALDSLLERHPALETGEVAALARAVEAQSAGISLAALDAELARLQDIPHQKQVLFAKRLQELRDGLSRVGRQFAALVQESEKKSEATHLSHHRDGRLARRAAVRTALAIAIAGAVWRFSGWQGGPLLVMMAAVWCSVFSARHDASAAFVTLFKASACACLAAFVTGRFLVPPGAPLWQSLGWQAACLLPGALLIANPRTALLGSLYASNYVLFLSPTQPMAFALDRFTALGLGFFSGTGLSWAVFRWLLPAHPDHAIHNLRRKIVLDLQLLAQAGSRANATEWETRTYHRLGRLIAISNAQGRDASALVTGGLAALQIGRDLIKTGATDPAFAALAFQALSEVSRHPERTAQGLRAGAASLGAHPRDTLEEMANHVAAHAAFFRL